MHNHDNLESSCNDNRILLSVVVANYNYGQFLEEAIRSVCAQKANSRIELIVCDAASTDNSVEIIKKYACGLPPNTPISQWEPSGELVNTHQSSATKISWWCSEKDGGQSAAFNKGFSHARGRFITWLNADDILLPGTVAALERQLVRHPQCEWFTGNYLQFRQDNKRIIFAPWGPHIMPDIVQTFDSPLVIFGPTTFWSRDAYNHVGPIDEALHYSMDTDYWIRMKKAGYKQCRLNHCCWAFRMHQKSKTAQYEGHEVEDSVRARWFEELDRVNKKSAYQCSVIRQLLTRFVRILDGSAFVSVYRKFTVVGRVLNLEFIA